LSANTLYHFRIVATNASGTSQGVDKTFTTVGAPTVTGLGAGAVGSAGEEMTFKAVVDPNGQSTTYQFEYGLSKESLTNVVPVPAGSAGSGYEGVIVDYVAKGLTPGTTYFLRISATNASGKVTSSVVTFMSSYEPGIQGVSATEISRTGVSLNATIEPHEYATTYYFEYGTTTSYGTKTTSKEIAAEVASKAVSESIAGLKENTLYHYRVVATNAEGTHAGPDQMFTTLMAATLYPKGSAEALKAGANLRAFSSSLGFTGASGSHSCSEAEFNGTVKENPPAVQSVVTARVQTAGGACSWKTSYTVVYTIPTSGITIEYAKNGSGEAFARTSKFVLKEVVYFEKKYVFAECEYDLVLAGSFKTATAAEPTLSGMTVEKATQSPLCPGPETVSGKFVVTSSGTAVEVK
jgi:hypothetical protein